MKRTAKHIAFIVALAATALATACSATDTEAEKQTDNILTYFKDKLTPERKLGTDPLTLGDSLYMVTDGIYKYIHTLSAEPEPRLVKNGDRISYRFAIFEFTTGPSTTPVYSNYPEYAESMGWPTEEKILTVGNGDIIKSIDNALPDCQTGSEVAFIIPSNKLFDDEAAGTVLWDTVLMYRILITDIKE